ncbi:MAG: hypothetical protein QNJ40_14580 [Xanthomonadales bacterium]|nr:hypothetical protein [Xanthomonadales bacterium]
MRTILLIFSLMVPIWGVTEPLEPVFTFQGVLQQSGAPATGDYDFQFDLYDVNADGVPIARTLELDDVAVSDGLFSVELDFGYGPFAGDQLWIEVAVRSGNDRGAYLRLLPRQKITAQPYAMHAEMVAFGSVGAAEVDGQEVQLRVAESCPSGSHISAIAANGNVTCNADADTTYTAGDGLALSGVTFSADTSVVQARVSSFCDRGSYIRAIAADGAVTCQEDARNTSASNLTTGTLNTERYDAYQDLSEAGHLDNDAAEDLLTRERADLRYRTGSASVSANSFLSGNCSIQRQIDRVSFGAGGNCIAYAPIQLPDKVTVTGLTCAIWDTSLQSNMKVSLLRTRAFVDSQSLDTETVVDTPPHPPTPGYALLTSTLVNFAKVRNSRSTYSLKVETAGPAVGTSLALHGCSVSYEQ